MNGDRERPSLIRKKAMDVAGDEELAISSEDLDEVRVNDDEPECNRRFQERRGLWNERIVWEELQSLPNAERTNELMKKGDVKEIAERDDYLRAGVLFACWDNNRDVLLELLKAKANPNMHDDHGRTGLHIAAFRGNAECVQLLVDARANVTKWDDVKRATALHCAASIGCLACTRKLVRAGADINAGLNSPTAQSPLQHAVQANAVDCVRELLEEGACPNTTQVFSETPLHTAAAMGYAECARLLLQHGADPRVQYGPARITALHLAAEDDNAECVRLLLDSKADIEARNRKGQTALHFAALAQSTGALELLLARGANPNRADADGRTPLHAAIVKVSRSCECVKLLLRAGADVNAADIYGYTPLHIAALNEFSYCVQLLIDYGGDITARTNGGASVLSFVVRRTPDILPKFIDRLDSSVKLTDHDIGDVDCELKLDFRALVPCVGRGETDLLLNFVDVGQRAVLKHPLCETFLFLKWKRIRKFFLMSLIYRVIYVVLFTVYTTGVYIQNCPPAPPAPTSTRPGARAFPMIKPPCKTGAYVEIVGGALLFLNVLSTIKELFQVAHSWRGYVNHWENWLQWVTIACVFLCDVPGAEVDIKKQVATWQHHVAAVGIFFAWLEIMMVVGRFPTFGLYFQMFTSVTCNFVKCLVAYSSLLVAFGLSFGVLLVNYKSFSNFERSLLKTLIMMSGELKFEDVFFSEENDYRILYKGTVHLFFVLFVLLVTVILANLMMGLAVSDIQELQQSAGLDRLVRQTELIAHLESMLFSRLLQYVPQKLLALCHKSALLLTSHYRWMFYIRPNDPRESRLPKDLVRSIYKLVVERKPRTRSGKSIRRSRKRNFERSESELRMLSRMYSYNSAENLSNLKAQVENINQEIETFNASLQAKLDSMYSTIAMIKNAK